MPVRSFPETTEEHVAYIYELLRRLRPNVDVTEIIQQVVQQVTQGEDEDECPCPVNVRICTPGGPDYGEEAMEML